MSETLPLSKSSLRERTERLRSLLEFLPTLRLRQQQLQAALVRVQAQQARGQQQQQDLRARIRPWAALLGALAPAARPYAQVQRVQTRAVSVAGVTVPRLERVHFVPRAPDLLATPPVLDDAVAVLREQAELRAQREVLAEQARRLARELARTSQRINLYQEVLVPRTRREIRRLRVYLGDQQTAAVCRAKRAKTKVLARAAQWEGGAAHGHR